MRVMSREVPTPKRVVVTLGALGLVAALLAAGYALERRPVSSIADEGPSTAQMGEARNAMAGNGAMLSADSAKLSAAPPAVGAAGGSAAAAPAAPQQALPPVSPSIVDRMIVKTGALTLRLAERPSGDALTAALQRVNGVVAGIPGAYVAASSTSYRAGTLGDGSSAPGAAREIAPPKPFPIPQPQPQPSTIATLTLKVPVDAFDQTMQRLREIGSPLSEHVSTQEVTEEYVDLEAQVRNLEATEQQYLRFLERAQRIEEILPIQQRLTEVRGQIERLRGRMTLLQRRADVSTITVSLTVPAANGSVTGEPRALRTLKEAWTHLSVALSGALDLLIYVAVYALPLAPIVAAVIWWRRRQASSAAPATAGGAV